MPKPMPTGAIALASEFPQLGQPCSFSITTDGFKGQLNPSVHLVAKQNDVVVYGETIHLDPHATSVTFTLGGGSSDWKNDTPPADAQQPAICTARLFYIDQHDDQQDLAVTPEFEAAGLA